MNFSFFVCLPNEKPTKIVLDEENQNNYISQAIVDNLLQIGEIIVDGDQAFVEFHLKILGACSCLPFSLSLLRWTPALRPSSPPSPPSSPFPSRTS
ncbi:hypothetical protein Taro_006269 [Colocasia esculenta]|uniref:Uncharacterized protein n=1 Tax=Colocasia esculenta TaxID=4460 RepID=A0A843TS24_COLES|nr:hypothetical protein [Colocasia esculenta]